MTDRIYNFSAGPAVLPEPVLRKAQEAIWNVAGSGIGIMEHSHRGKVFDKILAEAEANCRALAGIPDDYAVLFLQGGASLQFSMVPMNFLPADRTADYLSPASGRRRRSRKPRSSAARCTSPPAARPPTSTGSPRRPRSRTRPSPAYVHLTTNNTIYGTQWRSEPAVPAGVPLVADTSSDMYSRPIDVRKYGLIYAGAQKNLGPSGVGAGDHPEGPGGGRPQDAADDAAVPHVRRRSSSLYNTPPTLGIYLVGEVFKWIQAQGGLAAMAEHNAAKAKLLYDYIDASDFFRGTVQPDSRSLMNVCFRAPDRGAGEQVHRRGHEARARRAQGPSVRGRHAGEHLQRVPARGRRGAGQVHEGVRAGQPERRRPDLSLG